MSLKFPGLLLIFEVKDCCCCCENEISASILYNIFMF